MDPVTTGAIITGGASLVNNLLGFASANKQFKNQKKLMQEQYRLNNMSVEHQWSNQYGAQVQGMKGAGLNPALMQGGSFGMNSAPTVSSGSAAAPPVSPISASDVAQYARMAAEIDNIKADTKLKEEEANRNKANTQLLKAQLPSMLQQNSPEWLALNLDERKKQIDLLESQNGFTKQQTDNLKKTVDLIEAQKELTQQQKANLQAGIIQIAANVKKTLAEANESKVRVAVHYATVNYLKSQAKLNKELADTEDFKRKLLKAEEELAKENKNLAKQNTDKAKADTEKANAEKLGQDIQNGLNELTLEAFGDMPEGGKKMKSFQILMSCFNLLGMISD